MFFLRLASNNDDQTPLVSQNARTSLPILNTLNPKISTGIWRPKNGNHEPRNSDGFAFLSSEYPSFRSEIARRPISTCRIQKLENLKPKAEIQNPESCPLSPFAFRLSWTLISCPFSLPRNSMPPEPIAHAPALQTVQCRGLYIRRG